MSATHPVQNDLFYRSLFANALDGVLITDEKGWINFASDSVSQLLGFQPDEITGTNTFEYAHPDDRELAYSAFMNEVTQTPAVKFISIRLRQKSGDYIWAMVRGHNLVNDPYVKGIVIYCSDDTMRRQTDAALRETEQRLRQQATILSNVTDVIITTDLDRVVTSWNKVLEQMTGISENEAVGRPFREVLKVSYAPFTNEQVAETVLRDGIWRGEVTFRDKRGEEVCLLHTISLLQDDTGTRFGLLGVGKDITERKKVKAKLIENEQEFRRLISSLQQGIVVQNAKGEIIFSNPSAQQIIGMSDQSLQGVTTKDPQWKVIHEDGSEFHWYERPSYIALETKKPVRNITMGVWRPDRGGWVWTLTNADPNLDEDGNVTSVVISFTDITEQKRLSRQLIRQELLKQKQLTQATIDGQEKERLEIGKELHDNINQHLSTTRLYLEVAREKASGELLEMINYSHNTLAAIINKIRMLSQALVPPTLDDLGLVESVQELCDTLKRTHKYQAELYSRHFNEEQLPENLNVMLFRIVQEQINNIIRHAEARKIQIRLEADAEYIVLTITDDGKGFDPATYKRGQGFNNISSRAGLFNGQVQIDAAPGEGCKLMVTIPLTNNQEPDDLM